MSDHLSALFANVINTDLVSAYIVALSLVSTTSHSLRQLQDARSTISAYTLYPELENLLLIKTQKMLENTNKVQTANLAEAKIGHSDTIYLI